MADLAYKAALVHSLKGCLDRHKIAHALKIYVQYTHSLEHSLEFFGPTQTTDTHKQSEGLFGQTQTTPPNIYTNSQKGSDTHSLPALIGAYLCPNI